MANSGCLKIVPHFAFAWKCNRQCGERSPFFKAQQKEFQLQFYTRWDESTMSDYRLRLYNKEQLPEPFHLWVYLLIGEESVSHSTATVRNLRDDIIWKSTESNLRTIVPDFEERPFRFIIVLTGSPETGDKSVQTPTFLDPKFRLEDLSGDFSKLLDGEDSSPDVELVCGDRTWKAHRSLLSCRSEVLRAMLQSDMVEGKSGRVQIRDTKAATFDQFLHYLYTGRLPEITVDIAIQLYEHGDRYSVKGIKEVCVCFLVDNLTRDNACTILSLADRHNDQAFKQSVISYILDKKIPLYEEHWSDFANDRPQLAIEIYDKFVRLHISK